jgi:hypothetical protein
MSRPAYEVAAQAIICGALGFRASLEVTEHRRTEELSARLLSWLEDLGVGAQIEPYHREILETPHGKLPRDFQTEANWRGESAAVFGWSIFLFDTPHPVDRIGPGVLVSKLQILQPFADQILAGAKLRPKPEIDAYCLFCLEVRHQFQLKALPEETQATLSNIHPTRLAELGLNEAFYRSDAIDKKAADVASAAPEAKGLYVVRALAAEWLLGVE